jgi:hypothetical protein
VKNEIIEVDGVKWFVHQAFTLNHALDAVGLSRCLGTTGTRTTLMVESTGQEIVMASVTRIRPDGTLAIPS